MKKVVYIAVVLLAILHQDIWLWTDERLLFGFMPSGLAYHAAYSLAAAAVWAAAVKFAWPAEIEAFAEPPNSPEQGREDA